MAMVLAACGGAPRDDGEEVLTDWRVMTVDECASEELPGWMACMDGQDPALTCRDLARRCENDWFDVERLNECGTTQELADECMHMRQTLDDFRRCERTDRAEWTDVPEPACE